MLGLVFGIASPLLALCLSMRKENRSAIFFVAEYAMFVLLIFVVSALMLVPTSRMSIEFGFEDLFPRISFGKTAPIVAMLLAAVVGECSYRLKKRLKIEKSIEPNRKEKKGIVKTVVGTFVLFWSILLTSCYLWARRYYGNISFEEMIFHINMPLQGTASSFIRDIALQAIAPALMLFVMICAWIYWPAKRSWWIRSQKKRFLWIRLFPLRIPGMVTVLGCSLWLLTLYLNADRDFRIAQFINNQMNSSEFIEEHYVDPAKVEITFPEKKRNLICIYLESAETSPQDVENGGELEKNLIPEMTRIAKENISFSHSDKLEGAVVAPACGWTVAGLVAETAGLPLKLYRYEDGDGVDNSMNKYASFLPGARTLGDILKDEGYRTIFMAGSDFTFAGKRAYFTQHGQYEILDYPVAKEQGVIAPEYNETWGFEDIILYDWAKDVLTEISASEQPFHFSMLTIDTHAPFGYECELCPQEEYEHPYTVPLICSSKQIDSFLNWCKEQPFYDDTTIVVMGDHGSMVPFFYGEYWYQKHTGDTQRKVYNVFLNAEAEPKKENNRQFTTLDFFPTVLASIGVKIEGERLGLGTNLFSDKETLSEEYGYQYLFDELNRKSVFYNEEILYP